MRSVSMASRAAPTRFIRHTENDALDVVLGRIEVLGNTHFNRDLARAWRLRAPLPEIAVLDATRFGCVAV